MRGKRGSMPVPRKSGKVGVAGSKKKGEGGMEGGAKGMANKQGAEMGQSQFDVCFAHAVKVKEKNGK